MKHLSRSARQAELPCSVEQLADRLQRSLSDLRRGWRGCGNARCRRGERCFGTGRNFPCGGDGALRQSFGRATKA